MTTPPNKKMSLIQHKNISGYLTGQQGRPAIIVIQEWWGLAGHIKSTADKLATSGFQCIAPDLYHGKIAKDANEANHLMSGLDFKAAVAEVKTWVDYLKEHRGASKVGVVGFCMGGALTLACASSFGGGISAAVPFYGIPDRKYFPVESIECPLLLHFGMKDKLVGFSDPTAVKSLTTALEAAGKTFDLKTYADAEHAFMNEQRPEVHRPKEAELAFKDTVAFFNKHLH